MQQPHLNAGPPVSRRLAATAALLLGGVCAVHLIDGPGSLSDVPYVGVLELLLAAACAPLAVALLMFPARPVWISALVLNVLALAAFLASRTVGLPGSTDDIGNWGQSLGLVDMAVEVAAVAACLRALRLSRRNGSRTASPSAGRARLHADAPGLPG